jgi:hypothetical protein
MPSDATKTTKKKLSPKILERIVELNTNLLMTCGALDTVDSVSSKKLVEMLKQTSKQVQTFTAHHT